jgi:hypothetical protein
MSCIVDVIGWRLFKASKTLVKLDNTSPDLVAAEAMAVSSFDSIAPSALD